MNQESRIKNQGGVKSIIHDSCFMIRSRGFTLIELLIVIVVFGILASMASVTFFDYHNTQMLNRAREDLVSTLNLAKSNSLSQVTPPICIALVRGLKGYRVDINNSTTYTLFARCESPDESTDVPINTKTLPSPIEFTPASFPASFFFAVLTGNVTVTGPSTVTLSGYGKTRNVMVSSTGVVQ